MTHQGASQQRKSCIFSSLDWYCDAIAKGSQHCKREQDRATFFSITILIFFFVFFGQGSGWRSHGDIAAASRWVFPTSLFQIKPRYRESCVANV
jgi:hypothetical protein